MKLARYFDSIRTVAVLLRMLSSTAHDNCITSILAFLMADYDILSWIAVDSYEVVKFGTGMPLG